ncbi:hypothetical protein JCM30566_01870 [Marinitoga arctica]
MKRFFLVVLSITIFIFAFSEDIGEFYLRKFSIDEMINSKEASIKIFGYLKKYLETGYSGYLKSSNELRVLYDNVLTFEEKRYFDIISSFSPNTTIEPIKKLEDLEKNYPDSLLIKTQLIEYYYKQWQITGDPKMAKTILERIKYIENKMGETPFIVFYKARFLYESNLYGNKEEAYNLVRDGALKFPENKSLIELYLIVSSDLNRDLKDKNLFGKIAMSYLKEPEVKDKILLLIARHFFEAKNKDLAKQIIFEKIIPKTRNSKILLLSYEVLGDYSDTNIQKMNYYKQSLKYDSENSRILEKWALSMLKVDKEKYKSLARIALNKAITINPNISEEAMEALEDLRTEIKIEVMLKYVLPILLFVSLSISILIIYEKRKKRNEKEMILKDGKEGDEDE